MSVPRLVLVSAPATFAANGERPPGAPAAGGCEQVTDTATGGPDAVTASFVTEAVSVSGHSTATVTRSEPSYWVRPTGWVFRKTNDLRRHRPQLAAAAASTCHRRTGLRMRRLLDHAR